MKGSVYMRWAKDHAAARYNLANSGMLACSTADLLLEPEDVQVNGPNHDGYPPLKEAIGRQYGVAAEQVVAAPGCSGANFLAFATLVEPGDEVLIERPTYEPLLAALSFLGARVRRFDRRFEDGYRLDLDEIRSLLTDRVRLVVLANPHNPSGVLLPPEEIAELGRLAERVGAFVLVDEVYRDVWFEGAPPSHVHLGPRFLATSSLTKSYGLAGLRCGWILCAPDLADRLRRVKDVMQSVDSVPSDTLALAAFRQLPRLAARSRAILETNLARVRSFLAEHEEWLACVVPQRTMMVFPHLKKEEDSEALHDWLRGRETSIVPGRFFESPRHFRLGFAVKPEDVEAGLRRVSEGLRSALRSHPNRSEPRYPSPMTIQDTALDLAAIARDPGPDPRGRISDMAAGLVGSEILRIASEIRALVAAGRSICNLTVGDFDPRQFPIPSRLAAAVRDALERGETNYPPANGILDLRHAVARFYERELGLRYPLESVLIVAGARPVIYCIFRTVCDPGDRVIYPVPSWNNNHYVHLVDGVGVPVVCGPERRFLPTRDDLLPLLPGARLLCLNSPLNPCGTAFTREALLGICEAVLEENEARGRRGERPLYVLYDHIYWMLCFGDVVHLTPPELLPEMARYTLFVDGISKGFAATGLRVGWGVGPVDIISRMSAVLGHVGAWAPRAEQVATVSLLDDADGIRDFLEPFKRGLQERLDLLHRGLQAMKGRGLPVDSIPPMGAIYLTARIHPFGARTPEGAELRTNDDVRRYVLEAAGIGVVPFQAFGSSEDDGWFRLSVGAVSLADVETALPRLEEALRRLSSGNS